MFFCRLLEDSEVEQLIVGRSEEDHCTRVAVLEMAGTWRVLRDGEQVDCFDNPVRAARRALDVAEQARNEGLLVEMLVHERFGELRALRRKVH